MHPYKIAKFDSKICRLQKINQKIGRMLTIFKYLRGFRKKECDQL